MKTADRNRWLASFIGQTKHYLTVLREAEGTGDNGRRLLLCRCKCGGEIAVRPRLFEAGKVHSCGCFASESVAKRNFKHGGRSMPEYQVWSGMIGRCHNEHNPAFPRYGGRGIVVCTRWRDSFENFLADMGTKPFPKAEIDRIENAKGYEPGNCRWATDREQTNNRDVTLLITLGSQTRPLSEWCELKGLNYYTVWSRLERGWTPEKALSTPVPHENCPIEAGY